jgi:hypothetical protein
MAEQQPGSVVKKNSRGKPVSSGQKIMIHNIYAKFREQNEALSKKEMVKRMSEVAGIGLTLVWQTIKEMEETHAVKSPPRKRNRKILFDEGLAEVYILVLFSSKRKIHRMLFLFLIEFVDKNL